MKGYTINLGQNLTVVLIVLKFNTDYGFQLFCVLNYFVERSIFLFLVLITISQMCHFMSFY